MTQFEANTKQNKKGRENSNSVMSYSRAKKIPSFPYWNHHNSHNFSSNSTSRDSFERRIEWAFRICHWNWYLSKWWCRNHQFSNRDIFRFPDCNSDGSHCQILLARKQNYDETGLKWIIQYIIKCSVYLSYVYSFIFPNRRKYNYSSTAKYRSLV